MAIIDVHINEPSVEFEWEFNPSADLARALPFGDESESGSKRGTGAKRRSGSNRTATGTGGRTSAPSTASKLGSVGLVVLAVGGALALRRLRSRRARKATEAEAVTKSEGDSGSRRLLRFRSK